jgi:hypothetical protein
MLRRRLPILLLTALLAGLAAPTGAQAVGIFSVDGTTLRYDASPGEVDQIAGYETPTSYRFTSFGGAGIGGSLLCPFLGGDTTTVDCKKEGVQRIDLRLGDQDDVATVSAGITIPVDFDGGDGNDGLFGGGGVDFFRGGAGNDNIVSRDGRAEPVDCEDGSDTAISDDADARSSCEEVEGDADSDGVRAPVDCNDANPAIRPGVTDVPDNGVDEDCSGIDAINADRDGDGVPRPQDCDDTTAAIRPGIREVRGDDIDQNCDTRIPPFPPLSGSVSGTWTSAGDRTRNLKLIAKDFPKGTVIRLRCRRSPSCPGKTTTRRVQRKGAVVNLHASLARRTFAAGARIELRITRTQRVGRVLQYRIATPGAPDVAFLCAPPGVRAGPC